MSVHSENFTEQKNGVKCFALWGENRGQDHQLPPDMTVQHQEHFSGIPNDAQTSHCTGIQ